VTTIGVIDPHLHQQRQSISIETAAAAESNIAAIPSVPESHAYSVLATAQQTGDVIGLILQTLVVAGPARSKQLVADALPIQIHFIKTVTADIDARFLYGAFRLKRFAQQRRRLRCGFVLSQIGFYPTGLPV
jgi:hypothetical protein